MKSEHNSPCAGHSTRTRAVVHLPVVIDAESHERIDVLPDRTADTLEAWLRENPGVEVVCRDGSATYAEAIRRGSCSGPCPGSRSGSCSWQGLRSGSWPGLRSGSCSGCTFAGAGRRYLVFLLCIRGRLPWHLGTFLNWAYEAGLLRLSAVAYQFRHRELQDWLTAHPTP